MKDDERTEAARLNALQQLNLLDTPPSESFDRITRMAASIFQLPIAAVSLTDRDRQWFKSRVGVDHCSIPRERAPCGEVAEATDLLIIPDLLDHPCYSQSVLAAQGIRYYAGAPLVTREGHGLGALCVLGIEPRQTSESERAALQDLAAMVMSQIELQHAFGRIDVISGLPNRTQFLEDLEDAARDDPGGMRLAMIIDLAPTEQVSSGLRVLGPGFIDDLVRQAGPLVRTAVKPDKIYHVAPTQLAVVASDRHEAEHHARLVAEAFSGVRGEAGERLAGAIAIGVLPFSLGQRPAEDVLRVGYGAALDARASRRLFSIHSSSSDAAHRRRYKLLEDFESALSDPDQLRLVVQPKVDLADFACLGGEALLRWRHPTLGEILPGEFIPLIEHSPLVREMTEFVVDRACLAAAHWLRTGLDLELSINVSAANFEEEDLAERIQRALLRHSIPPRSLMIEITESTAMANVGSTLRHLEALDETGFPIAIDDFGTGYSSLAYLQKLPARTIKIDQAFIRSVDTDPRGAELVRSMIGFFRELDYRVIAEGVESRATALLLRELGCHEAQGYWFSRPMEFEAFAGWIAAHQLANEALAA